MTTTRLLHSERQLTLAIRRLIPLVAAMALVLAACAAPAASPTPAATNVPTAVAAQPFSHSACAADVDLTGQTVSLYHILALVGEQNDTFLQPLKAGFDDAGEYFNAHGGVCGATLAQVFADTELSPQAIYEQDMALDPKPVMVALYGSGDAEDLRDQLATDQIPGLGIRVGSIAALYGDDGQTPGWVFGTNPLYVEQVGAMCDYIAAHPELFPEPVLGFISWDEGWARSADTDESRAYCQSLGVAYADASYFASDATYIQPHIQNLVDAGANILYTNSLDTGPALVAKTIDEMGLRDKVTLAAMNWAMDPTVGLLGAEDLRADGLPAMSGMIGSLPLRSWAETDQPGIQLINEQADLHQRPQQVRNNYYTLAWASTDLFIETYIQTGNRVGFDHITGAEMKKTLENIVYAPLGGIEKIDFEGGARRTLSADRIGEMNYMGQDGKTPAGAGNPPLSVTVGGQTSLVPMLLPLSDFQTAPDLRPGGKDAPPVTEIAPTAAPVVLGTVEGHLAFRSDQSGNPEIYLMNGDGTGLINLTNDPAYDDLPAWSPDGTQIAYCSHGEIYVMNADGSDKTNLSENPSDDCFPSWFSDGTKILFGSDREGNFELYVMNADGSSQTRLTDNPAFDGLSDWSPDGSQIVFVSDRDGQNDIYVMNADGSGVARLTSLGVGDGFPSWSPDGTKVAFGANSNGSEADYEVYIVNVDGSGLTPLTDMEGYDGYPRWSPDGNQIVFLSNRDGNYEIYAMNADGSGLLRLTDSPADDEVADWAP